MPIPIEAALLGTRLKTTPSTSPAPHFWQDNAPLQSGAVTLALQVVRYVANLGVTMALARLLVPVDFGLFTIAATFTGLLTLFKDGGVETALLHHGVITEPERAALGGLTCFYGFVLAASCAALGPVLARLYGEPRLVFAVLLPAGAFLIYGLDVLPGVELLRTRRFRTHATIDLVATLAAWTVTILLAWRGAGYLALFATELAAAVFLLLGHAWAVRWRPRFGRTWSHVRRFVQFGRDVTVSRAFGYGCQNVDNLILGLASGPLSLAFYNRAFRLVNLPQESINLPFSRLAAPLLSQTREHPAEFTRVFRHFTLTSVALGLPGAAFLIVSAPAIVAVLYGSQWTPVGPLLRLLGVVGLFSTFQHVTNWVYTASGLIRRQIRWGAFNLAVLAAAFLLGVQWGASGVAIAASVVIAALRVPALVYCFHGTPLRLRDVTGVIWRPLVATAFASGLVLAVRAGAGERASPLLAVVQDGGVLAAGYALGWILVPGWRSFLRHELRRPALTA